MEDEAEGKMNKFTAGTVCEDFWKDKLMQFCFKHTNHMGM
jgi:hypothetical protein